MRRLEHQINNYRNVLIGHLFLSVSLTVSCSSYYPIPTCIGNHS